MAGSKKKPVKKKAVANKSKAKKASSEKKKSPASPVYTFHIISDATGNLAGHMLNAVTTQFPGLKFKLLYHVFQEDPEELAKSLQLVKKRNHLVFYALVNPQNKDMLQQACREKKVPHYDLTHPLVEFLVEHTAVKPVNEPELLHPIDEGYFERIEAMEFTAQHDDGRRLESIQEADIVIVGLSRVSKSPTSTFLGSQGYKVANVSIARETGFPPQLKRVKKRTVAFTLKPKRLHAIRNRRFEEFKTHVKQRGLEEMPYTDMRSIVREVVYAETEYRKRGYPIIDITDKTVEETSAEVLRKLGIPRRDYLKRKT